MKSKRPEHIYCNSLEKMLRPHDAMDWFRRCVPNGAAGERFLSCLRCALVALRQSTFDQFHLTVVSGRSRLNQRNVSRQTKSIDVITSGAIIERIQHQIELLEKVDPVVGTVKKRGKL